MRGCDQDMGCYLDKAKPMRSDSLVEGCKLVCGGGVVHAFLYHAPLARRGRGGGGTPIEVGTHGGQAVHP